MGPLLFAVAGYNLAETGRMIEIARAAREHFDVVFLSYGGQYEHLIRRENFSLREMRPRLTPEKLNRLRLVLGGETWNTVGYFSAGELEPRVENEIAFFEEVRPAAVLTGWCLSVTLSTRVAGVPFVNVLHSTSIAEYYRAGLQTWPDRLHWLRRFFPEETLTRRINRRILGAEFPARPYNRIGRRYGLRKFDNFIDLIEGDHTLLADIPSWVGLEEVAASKHWVGPLVARLDAEIPPEVAEMPRDLPVVYFAMGSSGSGRLVAEILEAFDGRHCRVIAPVASLVKRLDVRVPPNVVVTGLLPAHRVNPLADVSVIHGGQNTVMNACLSGTPIVGMGMHPEQEANLEACVRKGFAIRLNRWKDGAQEVMKAVEAVLSDGETRRRVEEFRAELQSWDGPSNAAHFLRDTFGQTGADVPRAMQDGA